MTRRIRKSKKRLNKRPKSPTVVSPLRKPAESTSPPPSIAKLNPDRTVITSKEISIAAPAETCFSILASQLEQPREWDLMIIDVKPVSNARGRIGSTSQITLNLGGKKLESLAMISRYHPNRAISWILSRKPKVRQDWRLEVKPHGTLVGVTLAYEVAGWFIGRFIDKVMHRKKVEHDLDRMLVQLKAVTEGITRNEIVGG